jgi:transcriptional regulator with XRE-family HTH domain
MTFGEQIRVARLAKKFTKSEAARRVGITPQYYSDIEKKNIIPSEEVIQKIVDTFELDEKQIFTLANKLPPRIIEEAKRKYFGEGDNIVRLDGRN